MMKWRKTRGRNQWRKRANGIFAEFQIQRVDGKNSCSYQLMFMSADHTAMLPSFASLKAAQHWAADFMREVSYVYKGGV